MEWFGYLTVIIAGIAIGIIGFFIVLFLCKIMEIIEKGTKQIFNYFYDKEKQYYD